MANETKIGRLILQLTKATVEKELKWTVAEPPRSLRAGTDDLISLYLRSKYKDQIIALYQRRYQSFYGETETFYWTDDIALAFVSDRNDILWEHRGQTSTIRNLFEVAHESAVGVDDILDSLLGKKNRDKGSE